MRAVWQQHTAATSDPLPERCDDVVVGAGVTGLSTGLLLARAGRDVCVLEAREPGAGTTGRSTGKLSLLQGTKLSEITRRHSPEVASAYLDANRSAQEWLRDFCVDRDVSWQERVAVSFAAAPDEVESARAEYEAARDLGLDVTWAEKDFSPVRSWGAAMLPGQAQVDPQALVDALVVALRAAGGRVVHAARVKAVSWHGRPTVRLTGGESVQARTVTIATGAPILDRGLQFSQLSAMRSYALAYRHDEPVDHMLLSVGQDARSLRDAVDADGRPLLLVGGCGHETGRTSSEAEHLETLREWTSLRFPQAVEVAAWSAQDQRSTTALPLVGRLPLPRGAVRVATGFDKWGLTNGPAAAAAITADILGDGRLGSPGSYLTARPAPVSWVKTNLSTGVRLARDAAAAVTSSLPLPAQDSAPRVKAPDIARGCGVCPHLGGILQWNDAEKSWDCPLHGSRFDADGSVLEGPATRAARVPTQTDTQEKETR